MTTLHRFKDIRTPVPAIQTAWLYLALAYDLTEQDGTITKEWADLVCPVLAYASLPDSYGAYLVDDPDGPTWIYMRRQFGVKVYKQLFIGDKPERGAAPAKFFGEHIYDAANELSMVDLFESDAIGHVFD